MVHSTPLASTHKSNSDHTGRCNITIGPLCLACGRPLLVFLHGAGESGRNASRLSIQVRSGRVHGSLSEG